MATCSSTSLRETEEKAFVKLFKKIYKLIRDSYRIPEYEVLQAMYDMKQASKDINFSAIQFEDTENVCAYLKRYASHGAGLTRCRVLEAAEKCEKLQELIQSPGNGIKTLKVVNLGGGPGNSAIGFCSALCQCRFSGKADVTVVDAVPKWEECLKWVNSFLSAQRTDFGEVSKIFEKSIVEVAFKNFNFPPLQEFVPRDKKIYSTLQHADIVLTCKFFSGMDCYKLDGIIKDLEASMKESALLVLIECPIRQNGGYSRLLAKFTGEFEVLYTPDIEDDLDNTYILPGDDFSTRAQIAILSKLPKQDPVQDT